MHPPTFSNEQTSLLRPTTTSPPTRKPSLKPLLLLLLPPILLLLLFHQTFTTTTPTTTTTLPLPPLSHKKSPHLNSDGLPLSHAITFAAIGDWGRKGRHHQTTVSHSLHNVTARLQGTLNFIVSTGDNFYENGVKSIHDKQWRRSYEDVYAGDVLKGVKWWSVLGNHDHLGNIEAQVDYGKLMKESMWNMEGFYYEKVFKGVDVEVLFVFLDTTPFVMDGYGKEARKKNGQVPAKQTEWFRQVMKGRKVEKVVVVLHHQMYSMSIAGHLGTRELRAAIEPILLEHRHGVLAVVSGHEHLMEHLQPYGGLKSWSGLASRVGSEGKSDDRFWKGKSFEGERNEVIDYFISGSGSQLDKLKRPPRKYENIWLDCCSILPMSKDATKPRAIFGKREHGFFVFSITKNKFYAKAFNEDSMVIYEYEKPI